MSAPLTQAQIMHHAACGLGKVDLWGLRGATLVSLEQIEAMALALAIFGLPPIRPDDLPAPAPLPPQPLAPLPALAPLLGPADA